MALGADRESLAVEISHLMPNKRAVEGAIKFAERQKRRTLAQKLAEIAEQKLAEELNQLSDEDVEVIDETSEMPSKLRIRSIEDRQTANEFQLKPKPMRKGSAVAEERESDSDSESIVNTNVIETAEDIYSDDNSNSNSVSLKPKAVSITREQSRGNPFKVTQNTRNKRKKGGESSDEDDGDGDDTCDGQAFRNYYKHMKQIIRDDNSDVEDEEEVVTIAKDRFRELDRTERQGWASGGGPRAQPKKQRKGKADKTDPKTITNKENASNKKITNFFTKN